MSHWLQGWIETHKLPEAERPGWDPYGNQDRRKRKMAKIDALSPEIKAVVHEFGWLTVKEFMDAGVTSAKAMRGLIHTVLFEHSHEYRSRYPTRRHQ